MWSEGRFQLSGELLVNRGEIRLVANKLLNHPYQRAILGHDSRDGRIKRCHQRFREIDAQSNDVPTNRFLWPLMLIDSGEIRAGLTKKIENDGATTLMCNT